MASRVSAVALWDSVAKLRYTIGGYVAKHFGIQYIMYLGFIALAIGLVVTLSLKETAPSRLRAQAPATVQ